MLCSVAVSGPGPDGLRLESAVVETDRIDEWLEHNDLKLRVRVSELHFADFASLIKLGGEGILDKSDTVYGITITVSGTFEANEAVRIIAEIIAQFG